MTPATPVSRRRRSAVQVADAAGHQDLGIVRPNELAGAARGPARRRRGSARSGDARTDQLADEPVDGRRGGAAPGEGGQPLRSRIEPDRQPVAGHAEARPQVVGVVGDRRGQHDPRRAGSEGQPDRVGRIDAAGDLERDGDASRDRADGLEVAGRAAPRAVEVDEVDRAGARAPRTARRSAPAGRSARRCPPRRRASRRPAIGPPRGRSPG